ncbi:hypothetical protein B0H14DRAFT_1279650 [Mycena olivaceomarginata]|nr:hypothetical protein B0H14DRAFT_1279650 [Mycena olivaceomarginata]
MQLAEAPHQSSSPFNFKARCVPCMLLRPPLYNAVLLQQNGHAFILQRRHNNHGGYGGSGGHGLGGGIGGDGGSGEGPQFHVSNFTVHGDVHVNPEARNQPLHAMRQKDHSFVLCQYLHSQDEKIFFRRCTNTLTVTKDLGTSLSCMASGFGKKQSKLIWRLLTLQWLVNQLKQACTGLQKKRRVASLL